MWDLKHDTDELVCEANSQTHRTDPQTPDAQDGPVGSKGVAGGLGFAGANYYMQAGQTGPYCTGQGPVFSAP